MERKMIHIKTEHEFYETIGRLMRRARRNGDISPYWIARNMHIGWSLYQAFEHAQAPISAYQLYLFTRIVSPDRVAKCNWPGIEAK